MGIEENNKELVRQGFELFNRGEIDACHGLYSKDDFGEAWEAIKRHDTMLVTACPDAKYTIVDMIAEGDKVSFLVNLTGTHTGGPFLGIPTTGKKIDITNAGLVRIVDNKIVETKITADMLSCWQQLGVLPTIPEIVQAYKDSVK